MPVHENDEKEKVFEDICREVPNVVFKYGVTLAFRFPPSKSKEGLQNLLKKAGRGLVESLSLKELRDLKKLYTDKDLENDERLRDYADVTLLKDTTRHDMEREGQKQAQVIFEVKEKLK